MKAKFVGILFLVIGVVFLCIGIYYTYTRLDFLGKCLEAKAVVVDIHWEYDSDGGMVAYPVFNFTDQRTGRPIIARSSVGGTSSYAIGQEVDILYNPDNPTADVLVKSFWDIWFISIVFLPMGSILTIVGLYVVIRA